MLYLVNEYICKRETGSPGGEVTSQVVLEVQNLPSPAGGKSDVDLIPGLGRSPGGGNTWQSITVFLPGESHEQRSPTGCIQSTGW